MSITLNVTALKTRESTSDPWQGTVVKSDAVLDANNITYDSTETYDAGSVGETLNETKNTLNSVETNVGKIIPVITGSTNNSGYTIASGDYFIANGILYKATSSIPADVSWSSSAQAVSGNGVVNVIEAIKSYDNSSAAGKTFDSHLSFHQAIQNVIYKFGRICLARISIKITNATSASQLTVSGYFPVGFRPIVSSTCLVETGLGDGKAQPVSANTDGSLSMPPVNLNTTTYAIGTVIYLSD